MVFLNAHFSRAARKGFITMICFMRQLGFNSADEGEGMWGVHCRGRNFIGGGGDPVDGGNLAESYGKKLPEKTFAPIVAE